MVQARLLLVDDDEVLVDSLSDLLEDDGYAVEVARNGEDGLKKAQAGHPDLIVLDLHMPVLDGAGFLQAQAVERTIASVPVLVFTSAEEEAPPRPVRVFSKPMGLMALLAEIHRLAPQSRPAA